MAQVPSEEANQAGLPRELVGFRLLFSRTVLRPSQAQDGGAGGRTLRQCVLCFSLPEPKDVFLEQAWMLTEDGTPDQPAPGSRGVLLRQEDLELLEFVELEVDDGETEDH